MLRRLLDYKLSFFEEGKPLHRLRPLVSAADTFFYEPAINTSRGPHIRDAVDLKRWMSVVVIALLPCILMAIWNSGMQSFVYSSADYQLMDEYLAASTSFAGYFDFAAKDNRWISILLLGLQAFVPIMIISYAVGGLCEGIFAVVRGHEIAEGFLVTGMLFPLSLPSTMPYWMVAVGVAAGVILSKELFGGTGMNIVNPALTCRAFLFFTFPNKMTGDIWAGTNPTVVRESLATMNQAAGTNALDGYAQASPLTIMNISTDISRIHVDAIATNTVGLDVPTIGTIQAYFDRWNSMGNHGATLGKLTPDQLNSFVTSAADAGGLGLAPELYENAYHFVSLQFGLGALTDANFFFGNQLGSMGETSAFAALLGALFLVYMGVGSWRTMVGMGLGAFITAFLFKLGADTMGLDGGAWNPAKYAFPAYKQLILGGMAFGLVFMATDPVSSPAMKGAKWLYGLLIGFVVIVIRTVNPAYPEGVMLAILFGNCFAPLFDYYAVRKFRSSARVPA